MPSLTIKNAFALLMSLFIFLFRLFTSLTGVNISTSSALFLALEKRRPSINESGIAEGVGEGIDEDLVSSPFTSLLLSRSSDPEIFSNQVSKALSSSKRTCWADPDLTSTKLSSNT